MKFKIDKIDENATYRVYDGARMPFYGKHRKDLKNWADKWAEKEKEGYEGKKEKKK